MYKTKLKWHPQIIKITYSIFLPHPKGRGSEQQDILQAGVQVNELTEYTHIHLFIYIYRDYLFVCPPIVPFSNTSLPYSSVTAPYVFICYYVFYILSPLCLYVILASVPLLPCLYILCPLCLYVILSSVPLLPCLLHTLSIMSFCLPFLCYHVFYILYPFGHSVFRSSVTMSFTYSIPSVILASVPLLLCLYILSPFGHSGFRSSVTMSFTYSAPYVFMSFWLHKCKVFLQTSYFVGNL